MISWALYSAGREIAGSTSACKEGVSRAVLDAQGLVGQQRMLQGCCDGVLRNTGEGDEGRLRELCEELLGPVRRSAPAAGAGSDGGRPASVPAPDSAGPAMAAAGAATGPGAVEGVLPTDIPGLDRRKLLREDVLREMSRNRRNQRLVSEFQELLAECA